jgi:hypothetical protein
LEGQIPYKDFYVTAPLLFFLGSGWAFQLFGVSFSAFPALAALYSVVSFYLLFWILRRLDVRYGWALALAASVEIMAMVSVAYWWYNPITSIAACLFLAASLLLLREPKQNINRAIFILCLFLLATSKPNVAGPLILFSVLILGLSQKAFKSFWCCALISFLFFMLLLVAYQINLLDLIASYTSASSRGWPSMDRFSQNQGPNVVKKWKILIRFILFPVLLKLAYLSLRGGLRSIFSREFLLLLGSSVTAFIAFFTNGEPKITDLPQLFLPCALFALFPISVSSRITKIKILHNPLYFKKVLSCLLFLILLYLSYTGLNLGHTRFRVELIGPGTFYQDPPEILVGNINPFFKNLWTGPILISTLNEIQVELDAQKMRTSNGLKVFFGPRMEFGYAAFSQPPPKGEPIFWWDKGVSFPVSALSAVIQKFKNEAFNLCIFRFEDFIYIPKEIRLILNQDYIKKNTKNLTVFYKGQ